MKKHLILLLLTGLFTFSACSNDDDTPEETGEPILGTWVLVGVNPPIFSVDTCEETSTITFNENNTGEATFHLETNDCVAETATGTWKNNGNGEYEVNVPIASFPASSGNVEFEGANDFYFVSNSIEFHFQKQ